MKNYRLKKKAVPFFKEGLATSILSYDTWKDLKVDDNALEEVEEAYITYGHGDKKNRSATLCGWGGEDGSHFHFTLLFPSTKFHEHDKFCKGRSIRDLMNEIQRVVNRYYNEFNDFK
ncbi:hypothetical protein [Myroides odoratimimus]|uniref:hypothetical protein n=1 Tax=Myroides odoratimimus TaxID=76832 RepID=UPI00046859DF|nr:hypothetical protein [Myroides odoratimimus]